MNVLVFLGNQGNPQSSFREALSGVTLVVFGNEANYDLNVRNEHMILQRLSIPFGGTVGNSKHNAAQRRCLVRSNQLIVLTRFQRRKKYTHIQHSVKIHWAIADYYSKPL